MRTKNVTTLGHQERVSPDTTSAEMSEKRLLDGLQKLKSTKLRTGQLKRYEEKLQDAVNRGGLAGYQNDNSPKKSS